MRDELDEIKFGEIEFCTKYKGDKYIITSKSGSFFGRATMAGNKNIKFDISYTKGDFYYELVEDDERIEIIPFDDDSPLIKELENKMWKHLEKTLIKHKKMEVA